MGTIYELEAVRRRLNAAPDLLVPSLRVESGRMYTLAGANGSGKTTLLTMLAFLQPPTSGAIRFDGAVVEWSHATLLRLRKQVTLVHQSPFLFSGTVAANVAVGLRHRGVPRLEAEARVAEALAAVDLSGYEARSARALSGGEVRRVAIARALVLEPRVLLLDEPLANLDRRSTRVVEAIVERLPAAGVAVVMSSHDPEQPARFGGSVIEIDCERIVSCRDGAERHDATSRAERMLRVVR